MLKKKHKWECKCFGLSPAPGLRTHQWDNLGFNLPLFLMSISWYFPPAFFCLGIAPSIYYHHACLLPYYLFISPDMEVP